jgi:hypothetical protein
MTQFRSSKQDPRKLTQLPHEIGRMSPGRREHIHGRIMSERDGKIGRIFTRMAIGFAFLTLAWFIGHLVLAALRGLV